MKPMNITLNGIVAHLHNKGRRSRGRKPRNHPKEQNKITKLIPNSLLWVEGEHYENTEMYPKFIEEAKSEGNADAERSFNFANEVEKIHEGYYKEAAQALADGKDIEATEITVCPVCGNTFKGDAPDPCPICGAAKSKFMNID